MHWREQTTAGAHRNPSAHHSDYPSDLADTSYRTGYEIGAGTLWAFVVFGPAAVVLGIVFAYRVYTCLAFGLPA